MSSTLTNQTQQTPLGFGPLGFTLEPGESRTVTDAELAKVEAHPVIAGWFADGKVAVSEPAGSVDEEAERLAAEEAAAKSGAPTLPKVPTPTKK